MLTLIQFTIWTKVTFLTKLINDNFYSTTALIRIVILFLSIHGLWSVCPKTDSIKPCVCDEDRESIACDGTQVTTEVLDKVFQTLSKNLNQTERHLKSFHLKNSSITELKDNTFKDITFEEAFIGFNANLKTISRNAFNGSETSMLYLLINYNPGLSSPDNSIFKIFNEFQKIQNIELLFNNITEIPSNAFNELDHLIEVHLGGESIKKIGANVFSKLHGVAQVGFEQVNFSIPNNAFQFTNKSDDHLLISFSDSPGLSNSVFTEKSLLKINRPSTIRFGSWSGSKPSKQMTFLNEKVFLPFLLDNDKNAIDMNGVDFDCNDCRNYWLKKNTKALSKVIMIKCSNKKAFNDAANFKNCSG